MTGITRRRFLTLTGAAAGLTLAPAEFRDLVRAVAASEQHWPGPGVETWVDSVCQLCPGGCGIRVRLLDGWPVKIRGHPDHPINEGALCPKGEAGLQAFYDPDRIRRPVRRDGARGEGRWAEIEWDEAIAMVGARLLQLRAAGHPERLVVVGGQYRGVMESLWGRFLAAYGSPNYVSTATGCDVSDTVLGLTQGVRGQVGYDLARTRCLLSFGVNLLEGGWSPVWQTRTWARLREGRRARVIQVDVRFSSTAVKADEWIPIRPGTDGALALGIAHVIVRDGLYDRGFVPERTSGFEDWVDGRGRRREGFRTLVLRDYPPAVVASSTGVEEATIVRIASEFGRGRPALAIADRGAARYGNGLHTRWAVHCLNALVGSLDHPGGVVVPRAIPLAPLPPLPPDPVAARGRARPPFGAIHDLAPAMRSRTPYPVEAVFLYYANPVFSQPRALGLESALREVPLIVSFSPYHDESTAAADLVLPDHTFLERWDLDPTPRSVPFAVLGLRQPVRSPLYDTRATSDVVLAIARALGDPVRGALPWSDTEALLKTRVRDEAWAALRARGWWQPTAGPAGPALTSGPKFEFLPRALGSPAFRAPESRGDEEGFPLVLNVFRPLAWTGGRTANMPYLLEVAGKSIGSAWESWVEVNPATAARQGIADGDLVRIESPEGTVTARARLHVAVAPGLVNLAYGLGHRSGGRWASNRGANPNDIIATASSPSIGGAWALTHVRISRG